MVGNKENLERLNKINSEQVYFRNNTSGFAIKDNWHSPFRDYIESKYTELDFLFQSHIINSQRRLKGKLAYETSKKWRNSL